jgi:two-component system chemotaxis response regulator CheB
MAINGRPVKVLIVDDSKVSRDLLSHIYNGDPGMQVVGTAADGREALEFIARTIPDVVSMDVEMPRMNGFECTRAIMAQHPVPIVIVTSVVNPNDVKASFTAMTAGALAVVAKPPGPGHSTYDAAVARLRTTLKSMAEVKVVRRRPKLGEIEGKAPESSSPPRPLPSRFPPRATPVKRPTIVVMGVSTGGPPALHRILSALPAPFPLPVVIVQHIAAGFLEGLCHWLAESTGHPVAIAVNGATPEPGTFYFAPDDSHLGFDSKGRFVLSSAPPENGLRPSAAHLFRSAAAMFGAKAVGVILTGMGRDGADELKLMRDAGSITIAQDQESSVVHGMPGEAIALGAARHVLAPDEIAALLTSLARQSAAEGR